MYYRQTIIMYFFHCHLQIGFNIHIVELQKCETLLVPYSLTPSIITTSSLCPQGTVFPQHTQWGRVQLCLYFSVCSAEAQ